MIRAFAAAVLAGRAHALAVGRVQLARRRRAPEPILIVQSEASYHAPYDYCTAAYLTQAGVKNAYIRLPTAAFTGTATG
jgi:hypothetical protein